jgi:hypothetical protein
MRFAIALVTLFATFSWFFPAVAMDKGGSYIVLGQGTVSCGNWTSERKKQRAWTVQSWALGYISAVNERAAFGIRDVTDGTDSEGVFAWIDNWCKDNPLENVSRAVSKLTIDLQLRAITRQTNTP